MFFIAISHLSRKFLAKIREVADKVLFFRNFKFVLGLFGTIREIL